MRRLLLIFALLLCACPGCSSPAGQADAVRLWTGLDAEYPVIEKVVADFQQRTGIKVRMLKVPFEQLRNKFLIAAPADLGPDLVIGPQDWVGVLATAGQLEPIPPEVLPGEDFVPVSVKAVTFEGQVYSVPLFMECNALFRNTALMPERPHSIPDLVARATAIQQADPKIKGFYFDLQEPYFAWPFFSAEGAWLLGARNGRTDPFDVGINNPGSVRAAEFLRSLRMEHHLIPPGASENISRTLFQEGRAAVIINGPWMLKDAKAAGVPYAVEPLSPHRQRRPAPSPGRRPGHHAQSAGGTPG